MYIYIAFEEQGTPAQLKAAGGEFARMVALQKEAADWQL